ncbi:zinc ribbon domain-containing protein [Vaginisenegalia massiliensis]|uniref:zinc ribbon domain-containing protein n=1 Tax=Vaginisenegalia massiliensis TaxID=2058294 RepID=UPI000F548990|nr:zinc ribbon domain-containing protein [Vaginisenegalia massiliensis]
MKYCVHCGNELDDQAKFCTKCGQKQPIADGELVRESFDKISQQVSQQVANVDMTQINSQAKDYWAYFKACLLRPEEGPFDKNKNYYFGTLALFTLSQAVLLSSFASRALGFLLSSFGPFGSYGNQLYSASGYEDAYLQVLFKFTLIVFGLLVLRMAITYIVAHYIQKISLNFQQILAKYANSLCGMTLVTFVVAILTSIGGESSLEIMVRLAIFCLSASWLFIGLILPAFIYQSDSVPTKSMISKYYIIFVDIILFGLVSSLYIRLFM